MAGHAEHGPLEEQIGGPASELPVADGVPQPLPDAHALREAVRNVILGGVDIGAVTIGALRGQLAEHLGLASNALDDRAEEVRMLAAQTISDLDDWWCVEAADHRAQVALVTFAAVLETTALSADQPLRTLAQMSRESIRDAILDAVWAPTAGNHNAIFSAVEIQR